MIMKFIAFPESSTAAMAQRFALLLLLLFAGSAAGQTCFCDTCTTELRNAVDDWIHNGEGKSDAGLQYGANIGAWCVDNVLRFTMIFKDQTTFNEPLQWNTSSATSMEGMFENCASFNQPLYFDVGRVESISQMFDGATKFAGNGLKSWETTNLRNLSWAFRNSSMSADISNWNVEKVNDIRETFRSASTFNIDLCRWGEKLNQTLIHSLGSLTFDDSGCPVTRTPDFVAADSLIPLCHTCSTNIKERSLQGTTCFQSKNELSNAINTYISKVQILTTTSAKQQHPLSKKYGFPIGNWCTIDVTDFSSLFSNKKAFNEPLTNWQLDNAERTNNMFYGAESFNQPLGHFKMAKVVDASYMFAKASSFTGDGLEKWKMRNTQKFDHMFDSADSFNQDISNWNVQKGISFASMFDTAIRFNQDISKWNPQMAIDMSNMFFGATKFNKSLCSWGTKLTSDTNFKGMFSYSGCQFAFMDPTYDERWGPPAGPFCSDCPGRARTRPSQIEGPFELPLVPAAITQRPDNVIVAWSGDLPYQFAGPGQGTVTTTFNPTTKKSSGQLRILHTNHKMFCPGTSTLANGRIMITGGSSGRKTTIYDPATNTWKASGEMSVERGYHSQTTLKDGRVFTLGGSWTGDIGNKYAEIFNPVTEKWSQLPNIKAKGTLVTNDKQGLYRGDNHMWLYEAPSGLIFHAGPSKMMHWISISGSGSVTQAGLRSDDLDAMNGCIAMYDINKLIVVGGAEDYAIEGAKGSNRVYTIDISTNKAIVQKQPSSFWPRVMLSIVVLPNGHIVYVGGQIAVKLFSDEGAVMYLEVYDPVTKTYYVMDKALKEPRTYHSAALLLRDGRIIVAGGGLCGKGCDYSTSWNHPNVEIITPPYLLTASGTLATRPIIQSGPSNGLFLPGQQITVKMNTVGVHTFVLMRLGSSTHTVNLDQRRVPLTIASKTSATFVLNIPASVHVPPGLYWLFALNSAGVPSNGFNLRRGP